MRKSRLTFASIASRFNREACLKLLLCVLLFTSVFCFRFWAAQEAGALVHLGSSSPARVSAARPLAVAKKKRIPWKSVDVNKASLEDLMTLPGIGPHLAEAIMKDHIINGPFLNADSLTRVKGIGPNRLKKIRPFLRFEHKGR